MVEELKVEEKAEVTPEEETAPEAEQTPEPKTDTPVAEISPEPTAEVAEVEEKLDTKERLGVEVKTKLLACAEEDGCIDALLGRFEQVASKLGIPTEKLIEQVFSLLKGEKIES